MKREDFKIGVYVLAKNAKQTYSVESYDVRLNAGMAVVCDILSRAGYSNIEYCSCATAHEFDAVLFSVTSDCDWWPFIAERIHWKAGRYKVLVGGQGVLNVRPFLKWVDYFQLGRCEGYLVDLMDSIRMGADFQNDSVISSNAFSIDRRYVIAQTDSVYKNKIKLPNGNDYEEDVIGCNHKCLFCGYTWHRKPSNSEAFRYNFAMRAKSGKRSGIWEGMADVERAIIDMDNGLEVDMNKLRTTAIDGFSERLRFAVNKRITAAMLENFMRKAANAEHPHQIKLFNIVGYPTETNSDWMEFLESVRRIDGEFREKHEKQTCLLVHSTPFRAMPATPLACEPMSYRNYRGEIARVLGGGRYKGNIFYQGNAMWCVESMATESLSTVFKSAIIWRGDERDVDSIEMICRNFSRFESANSSVKLKTLEKHFDADRLFSRMSPSELTTRNIGTYCAVEKMWTVDRFKK